MSPTFESEATPRFWKCYKALPRQVQRLAKVSFRTFQMNPQNNGLEFKRVSINRRIYSARVGLFYRALGAMDGDTVIWFWIGDHSTYERLVADFQKR